MDATKRPTISELFPLEDPEVVFKEIVEELYDAVVKWMRRHPPCVYGMGNHTMGEQWFLFSVDDVPRTETEHYVVKKSRNGTLKLCEADWNNLKNVFNDIYSGDNYAIELKPTHTPYSPTAKISVVVVKHKPN